MHVRELLSNGQVQVFIWARQSLQRSLRGHFYNLIRLPFSLRLQLHNDWQNEGWLEIVICFFLKKVFWPLCLGCSRSFFNFFFFLTFTSGCVIWVDIVCIFWSHTKRHMTFGLFTTSLRTFCRWFEMWCLDFWGLISHPPSTTNLMSVTTKPTNSQIDNGRALTTYMADVCSFFTVTHKNIQNKQPLNKHKSSNKRSPLCSYDNKFCG